MLNEILIATTNLDKFSEFRNLFRQRGKSIDLFSLRKYPHYKPPEESGATFEENAKIKAINAAKELNCLVLADDSGLVVPSLGGRPGIYSARYAGPDCTAKENRSKLLEEMKELTGLDRSAYFECVLIIASPEKVLLTTKGICEGVILEKEAGNHGFGYDSLFKKHDYQKSFAELDESLKNRVSHRGKAFEKLLLGLESLGL